MWGGVGSLESTPSARWGWGTVQSMEERIVCIRPTASYCGVELTALVKLTCLPLDIDEVLAGTSSSDPLQSGF